MTDTQWTLVSQAKNGDAHAFAQLYEKYYTDLYRFALCYMNEPAAAQDAVSEAVLKAYERLGDLKKDSAFKTWLFSITANECRQALRKRNEVALPEDYDEPVREKGYMSLELAGLLKTLDDRERLVVTLSVFSGYRSTEIANMLKLRPGSVRSIKARALAKLRESLI
ncbi:MAG: sigma-70 family RNA polymerase sigma factor [Eubacterium sp.]|nr:sigma-70 family RNA polymerase sigma factor [Eubacterium sp.]